MCGSGRKPTLPHLHRGRTAFALRRGLLGRHDDSAELLGADHALEEA